MDTPIWPGSKCTAVTISDTINLDQTARLLYVGTGGNVTVVNLDDTTVTFKNVVGGSSIGPFFIKRVNSTGTTASDIVAFY